MELVGHKGAALLDLWSISHFLLGIALGAIPILLMQNVQLRPLKIRADRAPSELSNSNGILFVLLFALSWEALEFGLEAGVAGEPIRFWLQGHEHWLNRLISDPVLVLFGYQIGVRWPQLVWPSRIALLVWAWVFLAIMPHSMAYQNWSTFF